MKAVGVGDEDADEDGERGEDEADEEEKDAVRDGEELAARLRGEDAEEAYDDDEGADNVHANDSLIARGADGEELLALLNSANDDQSAAGEHKQHAEDEDNDGEDGVALAAAAGRAVAV